MSKEKVEQNIQRVRLYLKSLGCSKGDSIKILKGVIKEIEDEIQKQKRSV